MAGGVALVCERRDGGPEGVEDLCSLQQGRPQPGEHLLQPVVADEDPPDKQGQERVAQQGAGAALRRAQQQQGAEGGQALRVDVIAPDEQGDRLSQERSRERLGVCREHIRQPLVDVGAVVEVGALAAEDAADATGRLQQQRSALCGPIQRRQDAPQRVQDAGVFRRALVERRQRAKRLAQRAGVDLRGGVRQGGVEIKHRRSGAAPRGAAGWGWVSFACSAITQEPVHVPTLPQRRLSDRAGARGGSGMRGYAVSRGAGRDRHGAGGGGDPGAGLRVHLRAVGGDQRGDVLAGADVDPAG